MQRSSTSGQSWLQVRYIITFLGFMLTFINSTLKFAISIAITEMVVPHHRAHDNDTSDLDSCPYIAPEVIYVDKAPRADRYDWSETTQGLIFGALYWLYIPLQVPLGVVIERVGPRYILGGGLFVANLCYLLTPMAVTGWGATGFLVVRVILGAGMAPSYPSINVMLAKWAPPSEKGKLGGIIHAGENFGFIFSMAMSGVILGNSDGYWPLLFYVYGGIGMAFVALWALFGYNDPASHPYISVHEKLYLEESLSLNTKKKKLPPTPWKAMARSLPLWGTLMAYVGHDWGTITIVNQLPKYMKSVLHYEIQANGLLTAIPYIVMSVVAVVSGWVSDWFIHKNYLSVTNARKLYISIAAVGPSLGLIGAMSAGCDRTLVVTMFTLGMAAMGFFYPSLPVNTLDLSPNYSGTIMGIIAYAGLAGIFSPYIAGLLAPEETMQQWRSVFWLAVTALVASDVFYLIVGSGEVQSWDQPDTPHSQPLKQKLEDRSEDGQPT